MKPSNIQTVKAKTTKLLLKGFRAITWMGTIYCKRQSDVDLIKASSEIDSTLKCHETIHVRQAQTAHDSWLIFYFLYCWFWLKNLYLLIIGTYMPYYFIPFEIEAYSNEKDFEYPNSECNEWKKYKKLSIKDKWNLAKKYKALKIPFSLFSQEYIKEKESR